MGAEVEPWLRGTLTDVDPVQRQVLHALELSAEDGARWCGGLTLAEMNARPAGVASVAFHLRHSVRSLDRLLTYAEGRQLSEAQHMALETELEPAASVRRCLGSLRLVCEGRWSGFGLSRLRATERRVAWVGRACRRPWRAC